MRRVALIGSRDLAQQMALHFSRAPETVVAGFFDDFRPKGEQTPLGPILGKVVAIEGLYRAKVFDEIAIGIGYKHLVARGKVISSLTGKIPLATFVHPTCRVDETARIDEGAFLLQDCTIDSNASIGAGSVLNVGCVVCHDTNVGENCFLGPRVTLAGFVTVEDGCFLGVGTTVIDNVRLAGGVQTGGGAVVVRSADVPGLYLGVPARRRE